MTSSPSFVALYTWGDQIIPTYRCDFLFLFIPWFEDVLLINPSSIQYIIVFKIVLLVTFTLYHGIHHHETPPFGRIFHFFSNRSLSPWFVQRFFIFFVLFRGKNDFFFQMNPGSCNLQMNQGFSTCCFDTGHKWVRIFIEAIKHCQKHLPLIPRLMGFLLFNTPSFNTPFDTLSSV